ncbi:dynactin subunit 3-like [Neodiprion virginianus]|uniref:dynactin subunit 3-like n=1 Tax=Neodiprion virginianus TaxID=2961670 RepID=UPI001EE693F1|nr:dynactin subunit 3-like [Neodiprion virginianus]XP_046614805.1 dynactin subunit 3-like [Neodiprion virginianus]
MSNIELLEERVAELENQVFSHGNQPQIDDPPTENSVVDSLLHAYTLISSSYSGREKANAVVKRIGELDSYLDPNFENSDLQMEARAELILTLEPELRGNAHLLTKLEELLPVLESERFRSVPEATHKLNNLTLAYTKLHDESEELTSEICDVIAKYNSVINNISRSLIILDATVTAAENAAIPVKQLD